MPLTTILNLITILRTRNFYVVRMPIMCFNTLHKNILKVGFF